MKRIAIAFLVAGLLTSFGCASQSANQQSTIATQAVPEGMCLPPWQLAPPQSKDGIYASGNALYPEQALAMKTADERARRGISSTLQTKTAGVVNDVLQYNDVNGNASSINFAESIGKSISVNSLGLCEIVRRHVCPDGTYHSLAYYSYETFRQQLTQAAKQQSSGANSEAAEVLLSPSAMERLDSQLEQAFK